MSTKAGLYTLSKLKEDTRSKANRGGTSPGFPLQMLVFVCQIDVLSEERVTTVGRLER